jgi:hypothetical protein
MTDLKGALRDLADRPRPVAQPGVEPTELWAKGVRRKRLRVAGAIVAVVGAVAAGSGVGTLVHNHRDAVPTGGVHRVGLPRSIGVPAEDSAGTADAGPLGRLAVLWQAKRDGHAWGSFFGISASTGAYRFLDLPGLAGPQDVALSPSGREVAYWTTGPVAGDAVKYIGNDGPMATVDGIARYNTVTGRTRVEPIPSQHGLAPEGIRWTDDTTVLLEYGHVLNRHAANRISGWAWGGGPNDFEKVDGMVTLDNWTSVPDGNHMVGTGDGFHILVTGAEHRDAGSPIKGLPHLGWGQVTTDGAYVVAQRIGPDPTTFSGPSVLMYGPLRERGVGRMTRVRSMQVAAIVGWSAQGRLLVVGQKRNGTAGVLSQIDLDTGVVRDEGTIRNPEGWPGTPQYADALLSRPLLTRALPEAPDDDWAAAGWGALAALALAGGGALLWRRRRARG